MMNLKQYVKLEDARDKAIRRGAELDNELNAKRIELDGMKVDFMVSGRTEWPKRDAAKFRALKKKIASIKEKKEAAYLEYHRACEKIAAIKKKQLGR